MQLTSLTLHGFKSFGDKTTIEFTPGVTAIVGPNGSGKSNVIDGLRWATGGGRASEFRAGDKTDLIFHGAAGKKSVGYAEVELELKQLNKTIHITRNLYRDGNTKLRLDGKNARFLDIEEELSGTGLGRNSLAIIGQGEVGQVLTADPEKLLSYVAEAAGVARLSSRRDQTQNRLDTARQHLQRLDDIMQTLQGQLELLREEAAQAQRHSELSREALQLRYTLSIRREESLSEEVAKLSQKQADLTYKLDMSREELTKLRGRWQTMRQDLVKLEESYRKDLTAAEAKRGDVRVAEERVHAVSEQLSSLAREMEAATAEIDRLSSLELPTPPEGNIDVLAEESTAKENSFKDLQAKVHTLEASLQQTQQKMDALRQSHLKEREALARYQSQKTQLEQSQQTLLSRLEHVAINLTDDGVEKKLEALKNEHGQLAERFEQDKESLSQAMQTLAQLEAESQALGRAANKARAAFEARRGYAQGPKEALSSGIKGVLGSVADLIQVPNAYRQAISSALGRRAEYVVVDTAETAQQVIAHVRKAGGWVTVLPLELIKAKKPFLNSDIAKQEGVIGLAIDQISCDTSYIALVYQLLGSTVLIENMDAAVKLARRFQSRPRLVTRDGNSLESYGAMTGGKSRVSPSVLGAGAELEEAEAEAAEASRKAEFQKEKVQGLQEALRAQQTLLQELRLSFEKKQAAFQKQQEENRVAQSLKEALRNQLIDVETALSSLSAPELTEEGAELADLEKAHEHIQKELVDARQARDEIAEAYREASQALSLLKERKQRYELDLERFYGEQARLASLRQQHNELLQMQGRLEQQLKDAHDAQAKAQAAMPTDLDEKKAAYDKAVSDAEEAEAKLTTLTEHQATLSEELESVKVTLARREAALELAKEDTAAFPEGISLLDKTARSCRDRLGQVEHELEAIGPVNHRAAHDLKEQEARYEDLEVQTVQATLAVTELEAALVRIDNETTERLEVASDMIRSQFKRHVIDLFGQDAVADIVLHKEEGRPTGLSIDLQPPGKRTRSLNLLSVGERTMGAMAFLFSLMQREDGGGLPIAVLDEVDAPLDEANIRRYCTFVERLATQGTQFVLITHQKATFDVADALWGITSEQGVSRIFSISRADYAEIG